jgi:uncharacterized membrane protein
VSAPGQVGEQPRTRPTVVTVAVWLLFLAAALQFIALVVEVSQVGTIADTYEAAYRGTGDEDAMRTGAIAGSIGGAAVGALFGIAYLVLAIFNGRGKNPARITTWVLAGLGVCCGTIGLIGSAASSSFNFGSGDGNGPDPADVRRQLDEALPSWYSPVVITLGVIALLALLAVIILLALPPANEFFRKPQAVWQPPAYPQAGGYPQPGGYPAPGTYYPPPASPPAPGIPPAPPPPGAPPSAAQPPAAPPPGAQPPAGGPPEGSGPPPPGGPPA